MSSFFSAIISFVDYCKTLNICGTKLSRLTENDILTHFNFGGHDIQWLQIVKNIIIYNCNILS